MAQSTVKSFDENHSYDCSDIVNAIQNLHFPSLVGHFPGPFGFFSLISGCTDLFINEDASA